MCVHFLLMCLFYFSVLNSNFVYGLLFGNYVLLLIIFILFSITMAPMPRICTSIIICFVKDHQIMSILIFFIIISNYNFSSAKHARILSTLIICLIFRIPLWIIYAIILIIWDPIFLIRTVLIFTIIYKYFNLLSLNFLLFQPSSLLYSISHILFENIQPFLIIIHFFCLLNSIIRPVIPQLLAYIN